MCVCVYTKYMYVYDIYYILYNLVTKRSIKIRINSSTL